MIKNTILPAHILRLFIWELLKTNTSMETINTLIPILPIEDEPRVSDSGKPYGIYGYAENESRRIDQIRRGTFSIRIWAPDSNELSQILNVIATAFESRDVATEAVNTYSSTGFGGQLVGIRFMELITTYVEGGEASDSEGGRVDGVVNISYAYVTNLSVQMPVSGGLWV